LHPYWGGISDQNPNDFDSETMQRMELKVGSDGKILTPLVGAYKIR